ncbi:hypothetical protein TEA_021899 [Camellia sinensis var. sinensis]|uniref:R13L1/DRL21-like LRR repeat region domain-containing protein n=1 Tax=Camellia sinensis var. sinensis TaxID=542762 RepID=A0A4S4D671_CAMSN|nr:hypothetical protein TEA_021899 [Camellia sinensis var. sinensis]
MHDLVLDLALDISKGNCLTLIAGGVNCHSEVQHLPLGLMGETSFEIPKENVGKLRTLFLIVNLRKNIAEVEWMRALSLELYHVKELPNSNSKFTHLRYLDLSSIVVNQDNEGIVSSSCNGAAARAPTVAFPALRELVLGDMPNLEEWSGPGVSLSSYSSPATVMFCPRLEGLYIGLCPHLTTIPGHLLSLQELFFDGNRRNQFWEIGKTYHPFSSIEIFRVSGWKSDILMVDSLEKSSKTLKMLTIRTFYQRCYLANNLQNFASLKVLKIENCADIMSLTKETEASCGLTSLQRLSILHCENLTCLHMGLPHIPSDIEHSRMSKIGELLGREAAPFISLESLNLWGWEGVKYLPDQLQHLTALRELLIEHFNGLEALPEWLGRLSSLHSLELWDCENLMNLLTLEAMQCLINLRSLRISGCPHL